MNAGIPFKQGGAAALYMPEVVSSQLQMKDGLSSVELDNAAAFWTALSASYTNQGYESVPLTTTADTTEQTIVDTTGSGVLTHVIAPALSASGTMTIRVTKDGEVFTFVSPTLTGADDDRFLIGQLLGHGAQSTAANNTGLSGATDTGFSTVKRFALMTPVQALLIGGIGMKFEISLKVTVQGSVNLSSVAEMNKCAALYTNFTPEGL